MKKSNPALICCFALLAEVCFGFCSGSSYFFNSDITVIGVVFICSIFNGMYFHFEFSKEYTKIPIGKINYFFPFLFLLGFLTGYFTKSALMFIFTPVLFLICIIISSYYYKRLKKVIRQKQKEEKSE